MRRGGSEHAHEKAAGVEGEVDRVSEAFRLHVWRGSYVRPPGCMRMRMREGGGSVRPRGGLHHRDTAGLRSCRLLPTGQD